MPRDFKDLVIAMLAEDEAELLERVASLEADVVAYRALALRAMTALHDLTVEHDRLRAKYRDLVKQYCALRAHRRPPVAA